jgi:hypothetical protein
MKLFSLRIEDERLQIVAPMLNLNMEALQSLAKNHLLKELEPATYLTELKKIGRVKHSADF